MRPIKLLIILIALLGVSCNKDLSKVFDDAKAKADKSKDPRKQAIPAEKCHLWYPVVSSTKIDTQYFPGEPIPSETEFVYVPYDCDSFQKAVKETGGKKGTKAQVKAPVYTKVDTIAIIKEIKARDSAQAAAQALIIKACDQESKEKDKKIAKNAENVARLTGQRNWGWGLLGLLILALILLLVIKR